MENNTMEEMEFGSEKGLLASDYKDDIYNEEFDKNCKNLIKNTEKECKSYKFKPVLQKIREATLKTWVEVILSVSPYVASISDYVSALVVKMAEGSSKSYKHSYQAFSLFEDVISLVERKKELCNLAYVNSTLLALSDDRERSVIETTITKRIKISDIAVKGNYRWVYTAKKNYIEKVLSYCESQKWTADFMFRHFGNEPLVVYYFERMGMGENEML